MPRSYAIKDWNDSERSFRVVASTPTPLKCSEWDPTAGDKDAEGRPMGAMVSFYEALEGWNFTRFAKNNLVFESHETSNSDHAIGLGSEYKSGEDGGLEMKVTLAPPSVNKRTTELEPRIKNGYLRGVSVGWDYGDRTDEMRNGRMTRVYRNNKLTEVSLVPIPADEDGLIEADDQDPDAKRQEYLSNAGRALAKHRNAARVDASDEPFEDRFDYMGTIGKFTRTQVGGIRVPARVTRTGVLEYRRPDGTMRRELRLASEVFNTDSLRTLQGATVTDLDHHRGHLSTANWKDATLGHTEEVRRDGKYVAAELMINDPATVADVENGRLHDISCGYSCKLDHEAGVWEGQPYDAIQRSIRYNHVAVLPKGKGRAGTDVALRFDARDAECVEATDKETPTMTEKRVIRCDGRNLEFGSDEHIEHIEKSHAAVLAPLQTQVRELTVKCDALGTECETIKLDAKKSKDDLAEEKDGEKAKARRRSRNKLLRSAIRLLASDDDDGDEEKTDALEDELDTLTDREVMLRVLKSDAKFEDGNAPDGTPLDKTSDEGVRMLFHVMAKSGVVRSDGVDSVVRAVERVKKVDAKDDPDAELNAARAKANQGLHNAWKTTQAKA